MGHPHAQFEMGGLAEGTSHPYPKPVPDPNLDPSPDPDPIVITVWHILTPTLNCTTLCRTAVLPGLTTTPTLPGNLMEGDAEKRLWLQRAVDQGREDAAKALAWHYVRAGEISRLVSVGSAMYSSLARRSPIGSSKWT